MLLDGEWAWVQRNTENLLVGEVCSAETTNRVGEQLGDKGCDTDGGEPEEEELVKT